MISRRAALRRILGGAAAAPAMAREAANMVQASVVQDTHLHSMETVSSCSPCVSDKTSEELLSLITKHGLPDWKRNEWKLRARGSRLLDPDIAALQSISLSARLNMQWRRNEERLPQLFLDGMRHDAVREKWLKRFGLDWF